MKAFLIEMFGFNLDSNLSVNSKVSLMKNQDEALKLLSHLANCQYKWLERIIIFPKASSLDWWLPIYQLEELEFRFQESTAHWVEYLSNLESEDLEKKVSYIGYDQTIWQAKLKDIALQLVFHSFHHRAQIQMMIRAEGNTPEFIDYIGHKAQKKGTT